MSNSNWESDSEPTPKKGLPIWGKILIGCATVMLLLIGGCAAGAYWLTHSSFIADALEKHWGRMLSVADALQTDEGALKLYRDNPLLKKDFPTEEDFLKQATLWRDKVANLPRTSPPLRELTRDGFQIMKAKKQVGVRENKINVRDNVMEIGYRLPNSTRIRLCWEDNMLAEIEIQ
jgi:hypothetical protein